MKKYLLIVGIVLLVGGLLLYIQQAQGEITQHQAETQVKNLPEVRKIASNPGTDWLITAEDRNNNYWYVQVAEVVRDSERLGHTATFNWYKLDKKSGEITCSMFNYDKDGKLKNTSMCI